MERSNNYYGLQDIVILVGKNDVVFVFLGFSNTTDNAGQVVCPFVEVSIIEIVFLLENVLLYELEPRNNKQGQARGLTDGIVTARSTFNLSPTCMTVLRA